MNKVFLIGRLTKDIDLRYTVSNTAIARFTLAVNRPKQKGKDQETDFINCIAYSGLAENLAKYQKKGNQIAIVGRIQTGSYDGQDGKKVYTTDIVVNEIQFLNTKNSAVKDEENVVNSVVNETVKNSKDDLEPYKQMAAKIEMDENYNPELAIDDSMLPF